MDDDDDEDNILEPCEGEADADEPAGIWINVTQPTRWPFAPLSQAQLERRAAMERKARAGCLARWPAGLTHLPEMPK